MATELYLRKDIVDAIGDSDPFARFATMAGKEYRALESRRTYAVDLGGKTFFVKYHRGTGSGEILKNLVRLRLPVVSARNEWRAIKALQDLGVSVPVVAGWGGRGFLPQRMESFIVTEDVGTQENLEDLTRDWRSEPPSFTDKLAWLREVARISRLMHGHGICHRDFYLCHFMIRDKVGHQLTLIDLHRALLKKQLGQRWIIKDIGSLYFSAMDIGLTQRDLYRFVRSYAGTSLRTALTEQDTFWRKVKERAERLKRRHG